MSVDVEEVIEKVFPKSDWYMVMRPFESDEGMLVSSQIVDASSWTHTDVLVRNRYIVSLPNGVEVPDLELCEDGKERRILKSTSENSDKDSKRPTPTRKK